MILTLGFLLNLKKMTCNTRVNRTLLYIDNLKMSQLPKFKGEEKKKNRLCGRWFCPLEKGKA